MRAVGLWENWNYEERWSPILSITQRWRRFSGLTSACWIKTSSSAWNSLSFYQISQLFYNICLGLNYSKLSIYFGSGWSFLFFQSPAITDQIINFYILNYKYIRTSGCDQFSKIPKVSASQTAIFGTSYKRPPLVSERDHFYS